MTKAIQKKLVNPFLDCLLFVRNVHFSSHLCISRPSNLIMFPETCRLKSLSETNGCTERQIQYQFRPANCVTSFSSCAVFKSNLLQQTNKEGVGGNGGGGGAGLMLPQKAL